jgi:predicted RNA methylase
MTFGDITKTILFDKENYGTLFNVLRMLHDFYASVTGISSDQTTDKNIFLSTGKAISPGQAASCLLDIQRTAVMTRGIYKAILKLKAEVNGPIHILYAGCGPYATLLTPLTTQFSPHEVRFHLMDVNQESLDAAKQLYKHLQAENYVEQFICADAATYKASHPMHLVISECMQKALAKEPQVAITQNLVPQLSEGGIFIPQEITVTAQLINPDKEVQSRLEEGVDPGRVGLGIVYTISQANYSGQEPVTISIPADIGANDELYLYTAIRVFEDEHLEGGSCSLTIPFPVMNIAGHRDRQVVFKYVISGEPGFRWKVLENSLENWAR